MKKMTEEFLKNALAGESQAHIKYAAFAESEIRPVLSDRGGASTPSGDAELAQFDLTGGCP